MFQALPLLILILLQGLSAQNPATTSTLEARLRLHERYIAQVIREEHVSQERQCGSDSTTRKTSQTQPESRGSAPESTELRHSGFADSLRSRDGPLA